MSRRFATAVALAVWLAAGAAQTEITADEARAAVEQEFGVEVLKAREVAGPDGPAIELTVMNPGGDYNSAFQVNRLMVDRETGRLISQFRHQPAGYQLGGGRSFDAGEGFGEAARRETVRPR